jgi:hypothetical protein
MQRICVLISALAVSMSLGGLTLAQSQPFGEAKPLSDVGGNAGREMRSIYRSAIGTNYSVDTLTNYVLRNSTARVPNVGQSSARGARLDIGLSGSGMSSKPFSNYSPAPTVSPYLNLFREDLDGQSDFNYQTLVRPQLQQQAFNERVQRENFDLNRRLQSIAAQADFNPQGSQNQPPTGHQTVFGYYGHYYPALNARRR